VIIYEWPRAAYIKQLTKPDVERLHDRELENQRRHSPLEMRTYMFDGKIKKIGRLTRDELEKVEREIDKQQPPYKDPKTNDFYTEMEHLHVWDWNIFYNTEKEEWTLGNLTEQTDLKRTVR